MSEKTEEEGGRQPAGDEHSINHPINALLARRSSRRVFDERRPVERAKLLTLLEAARWAPSSFNEQPWRYLVFDGSDAGLLERARACLNEGNAWARKAPLLLLSVARDNLTVTGRANRHAQHDVGLASENLVLQAVELGLIAPQIAGFNVERAREGFGIPDGFTPMAFIAVGYPYQGDPGDIPESLRAKERQPRSRMLLQEFVFSGGWDAPFHE
jgi:nitroreductase